MGFFDDIPPPDAAIEVERARPPEWIAPPENVVGVTVPVDRVLANTGDLALALRSMTAYPTGVTFEIAMLRREPPEDGDGDDLFRMFHMPREDGLRFGVELPDGRRLAAGRTAAAAGDAPRLTPRGGGGGGLSYHQEFWLWPLPGDGVLRFACQWPALGIEETVHDLDAAPIRAAAARAVELWPDERPFGDEW
jgi:hypothetical protein